MRARSSPLIGHDQSRAPELDKNDEGGVHRPELKTKLKPFTNNGGKVE
jgi:hypothetical protein